MCKVIVVVGGDMRQLYLADALENNGYTVKCFGFDKTERQHFHNCEKVFGGCDAVIFPVPVTVDGININMPLSEIKLSVKEADNLIPKNAIILGGRIENAFSERKRVFDYLSREELAVQNAVPTAEGAIEIAMSELPVTVCGLKCLITGYGRVSKALAPRLKALGADVTVVARRQSDLAWAEVNGFTPCPFADIDKLLKNTECVFNTVPQLVFDGKRLELLNDETLIIDLASKPGGVDMNAASQLGKKVIWALSLPGKVAPKTGGEIIARTIMSIIAEEEK